jgi:hypothetical protein
MKKRYRSGKPSRKSFAKTALATHKFNLGGFQMRGGIRL